MPKHDTSQHFPLPCDPDGEDCPIGDDLADGLRAALVDLIGERLTAAHAVELADVARSVQATELDAARARVAELEAENKRLRVDWSRASFAERPLTDR